MPVPAKVSRRRRGAGDITTPAESLEITSVGSTKVDVALRHEHEPTGVTGSRTRLHDRLSSRRKLKFIDGLRSARATTA